VNDQRPFTPERLAERWECSAHHIRNLCRRGRLGHFRIGKEYRIPMHAVEEVEACETRPVEAERRPTEPALFAPKIVAPFRR
jgi:excisionase family DNA binding protein